jgi:hypothetical protein
MPGSGTELSAIEDTPPWDWPKDAAQTFQQILTDSSASNSDRFRAAGLAANAVAINDTLADVLLKISSSGDEPEQLRAAAAIALGPALESASTIEFDDPFDQPPITERMFRRIQQVLRTIYGDESVPILVRRRALEASVRSPEDWHSDAVLQAYSDGDRDWKLTAVFAMQWVRGFEREIVDALATTDEEIRYEAVVGAGRWSVDEAWDHIVALVEDIATPKPLLLAAIEAVGTIRPQEAFDILEDLEDSDDEEIAEAAEEAVMMADLSSRESLSDEDENELF